MSSGKSSFPRGSGGCVLYPGSWVRVHGLKSDKLLNGQEGEVRELNPRNGRLHVAMGGCIKAFKPGNLQKVRRPVDDPDVERVLAIFQQFDKNGDGVLEAQEFEACLKHLGITGAILRAFLDSVDKDGDGEVEYEEFCRWACGTAGKSRAEKYVPALQKEIAEAAENANHSDEEMDDERDLTLEDVEEFFGGDMPDDWPDHGVTVVNNMRQRFPDYPVEGILMMMRQEDFIGGKVMHAIRATGAKEVEIVPPQAVKIGALGAFPAWYRNRASGRGNLPVYQEVGRNFSFQNMRDGKLHPIGFISPGDRFQVMEVRRGNEYGFCFGRLEWEGRKVPKHWVVLGLEMGGGRATDWRRSDKERSIKDLDFSDASRDE